VADIFVAEQPGPPGAPRVVFVHGSLDRSSAFLRVVRLLPDVSTVRYDRRGYGRSLAAGVCPVFAAQVDDLAAVVDGRPSVIFGHSLGGVVALAFAARHPELAQAVVAYEAPMSWEPWWPQATAGSVAMATDGTAGDAAERFMRRMIGDERWEGLPERTRAQRRAEGPALVAEMRSIRPPASAPYDAAGLEVPVIAACGSDSRPHHQETARVLAATTARGELQVVDGAAHGVHLSHPPAVVELVRLAIRRAALDE
jgi:pimeloyl-ACP methyl ester carboxylesterase